MTNAERLKRDIDTIRESIRLEWEALAKNLDPEERQGIRQRVTLLTKDLLDLLVRLEEEKKRS
jgi:hypothetical protein